MKSFLKILFIISGIRKFDSFRKLSKKSLVIAHGFLLPFFAFIIPESVRGVESKRENFKIERQELRHSTIPKTEDGDVSPPGAPPARKKATVQHFGGVGSRKNATVQHFGGVGSART